MSQLLPSTAETAATPILSDWHVVNCCPTFHISPFLPLLRPYTFASLRVSGFPTSSISYPIFSPKKQKKEQDNLANVFSHVIYSTCKLIFVFLILSFY